MLRYYQHVTSTRPLPVKLVSGNVKRIPFSVGDDVQSAEKAGRLASLKLVLSFKGKVNQDELALRLNDQMLTGGHITSNDQRQIEYRLSSALINQGKNRLEASLKNRANAGDNPVTLSQLRLWVRYGERK